MHGTGDQITSCDASQAFADAAGPQATFKTWDGAFHELHNETNRGEVMAFAHTWMAGVLAAKAGAV
jgi:alpha-beta hydrolase superfamily lysophospholipase